MTALTNGDATGAGTGTHPAPLVRAESNSTDDSRGQLLRGLSHASLDFRPLASSPTPSTRRRPSLRRDNFSAASNRSLLSSPAPLLSTPPASSPRADLSDSGRDLLGDAMNLGGAGHGGGGAYRGRTPTSLGTSSPLALPAPPAPPTAAAATTTSTSRRAAFAAARTAGRRDVTDASTVRPQARTAMLDPTGHLRRASSTSTAITVLTAASSGRRIIASLGDTENDGSTAP